MDIIQETSALNLPPIGGIISISSGNYTIISGGRIGPSALLILMRQLTLNNFTISFPGYSTDVSFQNGTFVVNTTSGGNLGILPSADSFGPKFAFPNGDKYNVDINLRANTVRVIFSHPKNAPINGTV
jgi:hypothetical protein